VSGAEPERYAPPNGTVHGLIDPDREIPLLLGIIQAVASGPEVEPLAAAVARLITEATATDVCFVHVLDDTERSLTLLGATPPFDEQTGQVTLPLGSGVTGWVASHREPAVISEGKRSDPRYVPIASLRGSEFTSMASVPMESDPGGLVGVLNVHTIQRREFTARDIELLVAIGRLVAGALHQARAHRQLAARERAHERFAEQVIAAQEGERRRLANDIHDGISQRLLTLSYHLDAAARIIHDEPDEGAAQIALARNLVDLTLDEARAAIGGLRPPVLEDMGLAGGLRSLARSLPDLELQLELFDGRLPEHVELALYRIAQECVQNIQKHARASSAQLRFSVRDGVARLEASDDGIGFDISSGTPLGRPDGYGLHSMAERAELVGGQLHMMSRPGSGTTVVATVPLTTEPNGKGS
jgi:signal transduction histidine kinase